MSLNQLETLTASGEAPLAEITGSSWRDVLGIAASISCAIHCAVMPIAIGYLPLLGLEFLADEAFHKWMVLVCFGIALFAFLPGWRRHRKVIPAVVGTVGLSVIAATAFFVTDSCCASDGGPGTVTTESAAHVCTDSCCLQHADDPTTPSDVSTASIASVPLLNGYASWLTPFGGLLLVGAHLLNHKYTCRRSCCTTLASGE